MNNPSKQTFEEWSEENAMELTDEQLEEVAYYDFRTVMEEDYALAGINKFWDTLKEFKLYLLEADKRIKKDLGEMDEYESRFIISQFIKAYHED